LRNTHRVIPSASRPQSTMRAPRPAQRVLAVADNPTGESRLACRQRWGVNADVVDYKLERPDWLNLTFANSGGAAFHHDAGWPADHLLDIVAAYQRPSDARVIGPPQAPIA
jgi:hypothetical protein